MMPIAKQYVLLDLSSVFNDSGISYTYNKSDGHLNVWGNVFPAEALPESGSVVEIEGVPFTFPPKEDGQNNNVSCADQVIAVPPGKYSWLYLLVVGEHRTEDKVYLHYASGGVDSEWIRVSDFWPETPPGFGEIEAFRLPYMYYPRHTQRNMQPVIWRQRVPITRQQDVLVKVSLPDNIAIHIFSATLEEGA